MNDIIPNKYILVYGEGTYNDHWNDGKGDIRDDAIVFVVDPTKGNAIYTHGYKFGGGSQNNESQSGGSSQPTNESQNTLKIKYGWSTKQNNQISTQDASTILTLQEDVENGSAWIRSTPTPGNRYYFCFLVPANYTVRSITLNNAMPINYSTCQALNSETGSGYISNTDVDGGITCNININISKND